MCKFALINGDEILFEQGINRIIDLDILANSPVKLEDQSQTNDTENNSSHFKNCQIELEWEKFTVTFSVSHPTERQNDQLILNGNHERTQNIMMSKAQEEIDWMFVKYGNKTKPWSYTINLPNVSGGSYGEWSENA